MNYIGVLFNFTNDFVANECSNIAAQCHTIRIYYNLLCYQSRFSTHRSYSFSLDRDKSDTMKACKHILRNKSIGRLRYHLYV
jgi:hypothetical protein